MRKLEQRCIRPEASGSPSEAVIRCVYLGQVQRPTLDYELLERLLRDDLRPGYQLGWDSYPVLDAAVSAATIVKRLKALIGDDPQPIPSAEEFTRRLQEIVREYFVTTLHADRSYIDGTMRWVYDALWSMIETDAGAVPQLATDPGHCIRLLEAFRDEFGPANVDVRDGVLENAPNTITPDEFLREPPQILVIDSGIGEFVAPDGTVFLNPVDLMTLRTFVDRGGTLVLQNAGRGLTDGTRALWRELVGLEELFIGYGFYSRQTGLGHEVSAGDVLSPADQAYLLPPTPWKMLVFGDLRPQLTARVALLAIPPSRRQYINDWQLPIRRSIPIIHTQALGMGTVIAINGRVGLSVTAERALEDVGPRWLARLARDGAAQRLHHSRAVTARWPAATITVLYVTDTERVGIEEALQMSGITPRRDLDSLVAEYPEMTLVCRQVPYGPIAGAAAAAWAVDDHPSLLVMIGICGLVDPDRQSIGDVVVADEVVGLSKGSLTDDPGSERYQFTLKAPEKQAYHSFHPFSFQRGWADLVYDESQIPSDIIVHRGTLVAAPIVVRSALLRNYIRTTWPRAQGIDMESMSLGVAHAMSYVATVIVKGISDSADPSKDDANQSTASRNAMRYVVARLCAGGEALGWPGWKSRSS
jgi:nucleoside phosphorylase